MDWIALLTALGMVAVSIYVIMCGFDEFDAAFFFLRRGLFAKAEVIAFLLPKLFTTAFLIFAFAQQDGVLAGVAMCAGSVMVNAAVIPAVSIIVVTWKGVHAQPIGAVSVGTRTFVRDVFFFLLAELVLIYFLSGTRLTGGHGLDAGT